MPANSKKLLKIGEVAEAVGKTQRAMHLYEELGLLKPAARSAGGFRLYSDEALERAVWIGKLQGMGFKLSEIQQILEDWQDSGTGPEAMRRLKAVFSERLRDTQASIVKLHALSQDLEESLQYLEACSVCDSSHAVEQCASCEQSGHKPDNKPALVAGISHGPTDSFANIENVVELSRAKAKSNKGKE